MTRRSSRGWLLAFLCCASLATALPSHATASSVLLGSTLAKEDTGTGGICGSPCTRYNSVLPGATLAAPSAGMITTWRVKSAAAHMYGLRILRPAGGGALTAVTSSFGTALGANLITPFAVEIPVRAGDLIALRMTTGFEGIPVASPATPGSLGDCFGGTQPPPELADGETGTPNDACSGGVEYLFNADLLPAPVVDSVAPGSGPTGGGNAVVINGSNFEGVSSVTFGGTPATFSQGSSKQFTTTAPPGQAGTVDIRVTTTGGTSEGSAGGRYTYLAPPAAGSPPPPPETKITRSRTTGRVGGSRAAARFSFSGTGGVGALSFRCKLDRRAFAPCVSPKRYRGLKPGRHSFRVAAVDSSGQVDASPATRRFGIPARD